MSDYTDTQVADALKQLGRYRVMRVQVVAGEGDPDGISGATLLALGLRETGLHNIEGGAKLEDGLWVPETDPARKDVGVFQISRRYHADALALMPGVQAGTWAPVIERRTAAHGGYCPRFENSLRYTLSEIHEAQAYAEDHGVKAADLARFAVAAHNAGTAGALNGYRAGDVDKQTTGGDYSTWVLRHRTLINQWLGAHPNWRAS